MAATGGDGLPVTAELGGDQPAGMLIVSVDAQLQPTAVLRVFGRVAEPGDKGRQVRIPASLLEEWVDLSQRWTALQAALLTAEPVRGYGRDSGT